MKRQYIENRALMGFLGTLFLLVLASFSLARNPELRQIREDLGQFREKVSPVLLDEVAFTKAHPAYDREIPVIVKVKEEYFSEDLENRRMSGRSQRNMLKGIRSYTGRFNSRQIEALLACDQVEYVTLDATIHLMGKPDRFTKSATPTYDATASIDDEPAAASPEEPVEPTPSVSGADTPQDILSVIGADQIGLRRPPTGKGVGVAVFDSGMTDLNLAYDGDGEIVSIDFTSGAPVETELNSDHYGHGTAVSGLFGGSGDLDLTGIAPGVKLYDLKVVGDDGTGLTSHLIQAIDWVVVNAERQGIRVANLSLGHPPVESYQNDPLCQAVERMVEAGVVTVVSAGNLGKTAEYPKIWGGITSPGNDPLVITVGAMNTHGTLTHSDDTVASYSSRGPSYPDNLFKPDLVAPGNRILCISSETSYLATAYPELVVGEQLLQLSGSSMATAVVSGAVALMLDVNPNLNPNLVKLILLSSAVKMREPSMLEQGNGLLNAKTAVELASAIDVRTQTVADGVSPTWTLGGEFGPEEVWAGGAFAYGDQIVYGDLVQADIAGFWGEGVFWTDFLFKQEGVFWTDSLFKFNGVFWTDATFWGSSLAWTDGVFWTDVPFTFDGVFWTDFFGGHGVFWTDALIITDGTETDIATGDGD